MHRLASAEILRKFRIASVVVILTYLSVPTAVVMLGYGLWNHRQDWLVYAGISVVAGVFLAGLNFAMSGRLRCPLCLVPPLLNRRCSKHRTALKLFGSHRLRVAHSILFKDKFRCPYCGEPTAMEVRDRRGRRH